MNPKSKIHLHIRAGAAAAWPICLGYLPIGLALGVLAQQAGIAWWAVAMMSVLVFAGSSQFICVAMLSSHASFASIIATTFVVNFRHTLMSSAMAVYLAGVKRSFLALFSYGITDESFAVNMTRFRQKGWDRHKALVTNQLANFTWLLATVCGTLIGQFIPQGAFGIDFALSAMFICLLVFQLHSRLYVFTAGVSMVISVLWYLLIPGDSYIVGAAICAASSGFLLQRRGQRRSRT